MAEVHHFAYGWITPIMAYSLSVLGSLLGLICTSRALRFTAGRQRVWWLVLAAVALGGTGIWVMHFMAMIGFTVDGTEIRYDIAVTALSVVVAIGVVGLGLFIVALGKPSIPKIAIGGLLTGLGVNAMHYIGMAAMRLDGEISYDPVRVGASIVIAVVAATVALWLAVTVKSGAVVFASAMVMGVAVTGMHYTGMSAMSVELSEHGDVVGASSTNLIAPIALAVVLVVMGLVYSVLAAPTDEDRAGAAFIQARMSGQPTTGVAAGIWSNAGPEPARPEFARPEFARQAPEPPPADRPVASRFVRRGEAVGGFAPTPAPGPASPPRPVPGDPAPAPGLGASLAETEPDPGNRWAGLTDEMHPAPRPITEFQYGGAQPPRRNTREPYTPPPPRTPTHHD
jgi:NO-binding membrane sensor protein with MHYT domain